MDLDVKVDNLRKSFIYILLQSLKDKGIIKQALSIPYVVGAYKIKEKDDSPVTKEYVISVFDDIINSDKHFLIYTCENIVNDYVITDINEIDDEDVFKSTDYEYIGDSLGVGRLYFEKEFHVKKPTIRNIGLYFWSRYKTLFEQRTYSYDYNSEKWIKIPYNEVEIIKNIINN